MGGREGGLTSHLPYGRKRVPNGEKVFQSRVVSMPPARSVHVETDGDAVGIEGHEEDNAKL